MNTVPKRKWTTMHIDSENIFHVYLASECTLEDITQGRKKTEEIFAKYHPKKQIVDMRGVRIGSMLPHRSKFAQFLKKEKAEKVAVLGETRFGWVVASFILNAAGMVDTHQGVKFFTDEKEAMKWLREN